MFSGQAHVLQPVQRAFWQGSKEQSLFLGQRDGFGTGLDAKLAIDAGQVGLDRFDSDAESLADLAIARALDNQAEDIELASGEWLCRDSGGMAFFIEQQAADLRGEAALAPGDFMHRLANFAAACALEPVAFDSQLQHRLDVGYLVVGGQDEDSRGGLSIPVIVQHSLGNSKAVDVFHGNIQHDHLWMQMPAEGQRLGSILGLADHFEIGVFFQQASCAFSHHGVVIYQHDGYWLLPWPGLYMVHERTPSRVSGTINAGSCSASAIWDTGIMALAFSVCSQQAARMVTPRPGLVRMWRVPPMAVMRSCIPTSPRFSACRCFCCKPRPLSEISKEMAPPGLRRRRITARLALAYLNRLESASCPTR